ncbi:MAG: hypothetical protein PHR30_10620 [Gallionellaceae bacterium]|nr:hypothetical protein [Gallionellaceae bacterium]MDD5365783.1 hypothetical protein [Gallionellaceae bacterium]
MEVSTSSNISQSLALAAYTTQQQQGTPRPRDRDNQSVDATPVTEPKRNDNVSFSGEALRLSTQNSQDNSRNTVNPTNESAAAKPQQAPPAPEVVRSQGASTVDQALNQYRSTSNI